LIVQVWDVETVRAMPPESRPAGDYVTFVGGMMETKTKRIPTTVDHTGPLPFKRLPARWQTDPAHPQARRLAT
jgi:hypothetical protein